MRERRCGPESLEKAQGTDRITGTGGSWLVYLGDPFAFLA